MSGYSGKSVVGLDRRGALTTPGRCPLWQRIKQPALHSMPSQAVTIDVDAAHRLDPYEPIWNWVGYDEPNFTDTANGRKLLRALAQASWAPVHVRTHNLLT